MLKIPIIVLITGIVLFLIVPLLSHQLLCILLLLKLVIMKNSKKIEKFVQATRSLAYWSRELLKVIDKPDDTLDQNKRRHKPCIQEDNDD